MKITILDKFDDGKTQAVILRSLEIDNGLFLQLWEKFKDLGLDEDRISGNSNPLTNGNKCDGEPLNKPSEGAEGLK